MSDFILQKYLVLFQFPFMQVGIFKRIKFTDLSCKFFGGYVCKIPIENKNQHVVERIRLSTSYIKLYI